MSRTGVVAHLLITVDGQKYDSHPSRERGKLEILKVIFTKACFDNIPYIGIMDCCGGVFNLKLLDIRIVCIGFLPVEINVITSSLLSTVPQRSAKLFKTHRVEFISI